MKMFLKDNLIGIGHIGIRADNAEETKKWYENCFGLKVVEEISLATNEGSVFIKFLAVGNIYLEIFELGGGMSKGIENHSLTPVKRPYGFYDYIAFYTSNLERFAKRLTAKNIAVVEEPIEIRTWLGEEAGMPVGLTLSSINGETVKVIQKPSKDKENKDLICGFSHLCLIVSEIVKSKEYYKKLGFKEKYSFKNQLGEEISFLELDNFLLELRESFNRVGSNIQGKIDHLALSVKDQEKSYSELKEAGFKMLVERPVYQAKVWGKGVYYFLIEGPDGEVIELNRRV